MAEPDHRGYLGQSLAEKNRKLRERNKRKAEIRRKKQQRAKKKKQAAAKKEKRISARKKELEETRRMLRKKKEKRLAKDAPVIGRSLGKTAGRTKKVKTKKQIRYLLSAGSPLEERQKDILRRELRTGRVTVK